MFAGSGILAQEKPTSAVDKVLWHMTDASGYHFRMTNTLGNVEPDHSAELDPFKTAAQLYGPGPLTPPPVPGEATQGYINSVGFGHPFAHVMDRCFFNGQELPCQLVTHQSESSMNAGKGGLQPGIRNLRDRRSGQVIGTVVWDSSIGWVPTGTTHTTVTSSEAAANNVPLGTTALLFPGWFAEAYGLEHSNIGIPDPGWENNWQQNSMSAGTMNLSFQWDDADQRSYGRDREQLIRGEINKLLSQACIDAFSTAIATRNERNQQFDFRSVNSPTTLKSTPLNLLYGSGVVIAPASILLHKTGAEIGITESERKAYGDYVWSPGVGGMTIRDKPGEPRSTTDGKFHLFLTNRAFDGSVGSLVEILAHEFIHGGGQLPDSGTPYVMQDLARFKDYNNIIAACE